MEKPHELRYSWKKTKEVQILQTFCCKCAIISVQQDASFGLPPPRSNFPPKIKKYNKKTHRWKMVSGLLEVGTGLKPSSLVPPLPPVFYWVGERHAARALTASVWSNGRKTWSLHLNYSWLGGWGGENSLSAVPAWIEVFKPRHFLTQLVFTCMSTTKVFVFQSYP